jgi:Fic family protein
MWIWKHPNWPNYSYDASDFKERIEVFYRLAERITGQVEALSSVNQETAIVDLMLSEAITTSAIEGEMLDRASVRSSLLSLISKEAISLGSDDKAAGAAALIVDVRQNWAEPLTHEMLGRWQSMVVTQQITSKVRVGTYRNSPEPMQIISGRYIGQPYTIHYEAPPSADVPAEMDRFLEWYNKTSPINKPKEQLPGPIRAAIAHVWFENIHPFDDGNGRVGRAISDHALSQSLGRPTLACLATAINDDRNAYYSELEKIGKGEINLNGFLDYFTRAVNKAQEIAKAEVSFVLSKARFYDAYGKEFSARQNKVIARIFQAGRAGFKGGLSAKNYRSIAKCSAATATRDLTQLRELGALTAHGQGRSTRYEISFVESPKNIITHPRSNFIR